MSFVRVRTLDGGFEKKYKKCQLKSYIKYMHLGRHGLAFAISQVILVVSIVMVLVIYLLNEYADRSDMHT